MQVYIDSHATFERVSALTKNFINAAVAFAICFLQVYIDNHATFERLSAFDREFYKCSTSLCNMFATSIMLLLKEYLSALITNFINA